MAKERDALFDTPTDVRMSTEDQTIFEQKEGGKKRFIGSTGKIPEGFGLSQFQTPVGGGITPGAGDGLEPNIPEDGSLSPMDQKAQILATREQEMETRRINAESIFNPQIARAEKTGRRQVSDVEGVTGQSAGFNMSTAELAFMQDTEDRIDDKIKEIEGAKASYISTGDSESLARSEEALRDLRDFQFKMLETRFNQIMAIQTQGLAEEQLDISKKSLEYQLGQEGRDISAEEREVAQEEKQAVQALIGEFSTAGITEEDSYEEAIKKASPFLEETRKLELQAQQADIANKWRLANGSSGSTELTGAEGAINEVAKEIISLEKLGNVSSESYWKVINELAKDMSWTPDDANDFVINKIQSLKGEAPASDFETGSDTQQTTETSETGETQKLVNNAVSKADTEVEAVTILIAKFPDIAKSVISNWVKDEAKRSGKFWGQVASGIKKSL